MTFTSRVPWTFAAGVRVKSQSPASSADGYPSLLFEVVKREWAPGNSCSGRPSVTEPSMASSARGPWKTPSMSRVRPGAVGNSDDSMVTNAPSGRSSADVNA